VDEYDNPAGRLHALLERFEGYQGGPIRDAWARALGVPLEDLAPHLGRVALLVNEVREAAEGLPGFASIPGHLTALSETVLPSGVPLSSPANQVLPSGTAMEALAMFSAYLHKLASEGEIPDENEQNSLKEDVRELMASVSGADLPPEVRRPFLQRLAEMLEALEHLDIGGPVAVRRAAEALAASAVIYAPQATDKSTIVKMTSLARKAWAVFSVGTILATAPLGWDNLLHGNLLAPAPVQLALPAGPQHAQQPDQGQEREQPATPQPPEPPGTSGLTDVPD